MNSTLWIMVTCPCVINLWLWWDFTVFPTTVTDSSLALWMTPYQFSPPRVQILYIRFGWRLTFPLLWRLTLPSLWRLFSNRHSERGQACLVGKTGNGMVTRSEESITLMTSYRLPHYGSRSFTFVQDDVLWSSSSRQQAFVIAPGDTPDRPPSFSTFSWQLIAFIFLTSSSLRQQILRIRSGWRFMVFFITTASLRHRSGWYLTVRRQKKLLAHAVRLRILACRNDLNRKRTISL